MTGLALPTLPKPSLLLRDNGLSIMATIILATFSLVTFVAGLLLLSWGVAGAGAVGLALAVTVTVVAGNKEQSEVAARREVLDAFADDLAAHYDVTYVERLRVPDYGLVDGPSKPVIISVRTNADGAELALIAVTREGRIAFHGGAESNGEYKPARSLQAA